jgi:hypothetical protein
MRRRLAVISAITALATATVTSAGAVQTVPDHSTTQIASQLAEEFGRPGGVAKQIPQAELQAALLSAGELPPGYSASSSVVAGYTYDGCPLMQKRVESRKTYPAYAEANFSKGALGPFIVEALASGGEPQARSAIAELNTMFAKCRSFTGKAPSGGTAQYTLTSVSVPKMGDEARGMRITSKAGLIRGVSDVVVIRKGGVGVTVMNITSGANPDHAVTLQVARKALAKIGNKS